MIVPVWLNVTVFPVPFTTNVATPDGLTVYVTAPVEVEVAPGRKNAVPFICVNPLLGLVQFRVGVALATNSCAVAVSVE